MEANRLHETQPARPAIIPQEPLNEDLALMQRVMGEPMKEVNLRLLPRWLQLFGYAMGGCLLMIGAFALYLTITA
ncbi:hypothetical protein EV586_102564 [Tumebacillus sp. BK434]|uniref:hypothetical protein n=1 Tax=Tumebacillus sp. BK434 TaxID=2512169 RepID=UPI00104D6C56|nr:hypothetical protein [Tumebacillus sp. BK434]TCP58113.1 hypothetical protein EV586_102564 [Tumebacillus sp. BK434]